MKPLFRRLIFAGIASLALALGGCPTGTPSTPTYNVILANTTSDQEIATLQFLDATTLTDLPTDYLTTPIAPQAAQRLHLPIPQSSNPLRLHFQYAPTGDPTHLISQYADVPASGQTGLYVLAVSTQAHIQIFPFNVSPQ